MSTSVKLKIGAFLLVALLITTSAITVSVTETAADTGGDQLLFDEGNGATTWLDLSIGAQGGNCRRHADGRRPQLHRHQHNGYNRWHGCSHCRRIQHRRFIHQHRDHRHHSDRSMGRLFLEPGY